MISPAPKVRPTPVQLVVTPIITPATTITAPRIVWNMPAFFAPSITGAMRISLSPASSSPARLCCAYRETPRRSCHFFCIHQIVFQPVEVDTQGFDRFGRCLHCQFMHAPEPGAQCATIESWLNAPWLNLLWQVFVTYADHRAVFEIASGIWGNAGRLAVKVVEQLTFFSDDARMVPLIGINLHDDHTGTGSHSTNPSRSQLSK